MNPVRSLARDKVASPEDFSGTTSNGMNKKTIFLSVCMLVLPFLSSALTKPELGADVESLSYSFYLYYDNGQLFGDRDYEVKYDISGEKFIAETINTLTPFKVEIINHKFQTVGTFLFDPQKGNLNFKKGKLIVKAPYVSDGSRANFYDNSGKQVLTIFVNAGSICDDDGFCSSGSGENEKNCPLDCRAVRTTPSPTIIPESAGDAGSLDLINILIYVVSGITVGAGVWFFFRWRKKKKDESFTPTPPTSFVPPPSPPPQPPSPPFTP